jgi:glycosyltransferase involved in cell wall biosynthesis
VARYSRPVAAQEPARSETVVSVSMVSSLPPQKGVSAYTWSLAKALSRRKDLRLELVGFKSLYPGWLYPGGEVEDPTIQEAFLEAASTERALRWWAPWTWIGTGLRLRGDVVHAQWWSQFLAPAYITLLTAARARGRKTLLTLHNVEAHERSGWKSLADSAVLSLADHVVVHSHRNKERLVSMRPELESRTTVLPIGPLETLSTRGILKADARANLGLTSNALVVLAFGNIRPYKGVDVLVKAFEALRRDIAEAELIIAGQPWKGSATVGATLEKARCLPGTHLLLHYIPESEVEDLFVAADVVVYPYRDFDAQSGAACLALSFSKAMIVSDVGGLPDLVLDRNAVVPPGDVEALYRAMASVLSDQALRSKLECDSAVVARALNWDATAERISCLYAALAPPIPRTQA